MVEQNPAELDAIFRALSDATRRDMLRRLSFGEHTVGELAEPFSMSLAGASKHIRVLERADLVTRHVAGRRHLVRLAPAQLRNVREWLTFYERFWTERLDTLAHLLDHDGEDS